MTDTTDVTGAGTDGAGGAGALRREGPAAGHLGELQLRRHLAGELVGAAEERVAAHVAACGACGRRLDALQAEQRSFEERISFDRFAAGVERARRVPARGPAPSRWWARPTSARSFAVVMSAGSIAAALALVLTSRPLFEAARSRTAANIEGVNRTKGDGHATVTLRIAPPDDGPQRTTAPTPSRAARALAGDAAVAPELLGAGERLRIGVKPGARRYLFAISIDDTGAVTPLYPEVGTSLPLPAGGDLQYLPDSVELTGKGVERLVVVMTDVPMELDSIRRAVANAFQKAGGNLLRLPDLALPGEQFHKTFLKP